jgi:oligopeptide/dipeptide ABC transporter ATP-binding protein
MNGEILAEPPVLEVDDAAVHFGGRGGFLKKPQPPVKALDGVTLRIAPGETLALVGESGCGKSTLANAILGIVPLTRGVIRVRGREVLAGNAESLRAIRSNVQMVFQDPALSLNPRLSVGAAVGEPLLVRGLARGAELKEQVAHLLKDVGLEPAHAARYPHEFSGGQRQRIVIARALALKPALVVCDEPVSALDVSVRAQILNLLAGLQAERGMSYLFVSHDLAVVRHIADRVAVKYLGRIVETGPRATLFETPSHPYTRALLAAAPEPDPVKQRAKPRIALGGELPSPANLPPGCAFSTRCPLVTDICRRERPILSPRSGGAEVACHNV